MNILRAKIFNYIMVFKIKMDKSTMIYLNVNIYSYINI